jgi:endonuclease/exonuclease/phosphatase family metal-dependent hydrolase
MRNFLLILLFIQFTEVMAQHQFRILTYNIYHGENPYHKGESITEQVGEFIHSLSPDLVALQEVDSMTVRTESFAGFKLDLTKIWSEKTGMKGFFAKAIDFSEGGYGEAVLSRFPAEFESVNLPLPKGGEGRSMAIAHVRLNDGAKITFAGTHLCHEFEENRSAQVKAIVDHFKDFTHPVIVVGDFNFESSEKGYSLMEEAFVDAAKVTGQARNTYPTDYPAIRIDYVWLMKNGSWEIDLFQVMEEIKYSDHLPVFAVVTLN